MCVFDMFNKNCHLSSENGETLKWVVGFQKQTHFSKNMEIFSDFVEHFYINNGKPWKSSKILRVKIFNVFFSKFFVFHVFHGFPLCEKRFFGLGGQGVRNSPFEGDPAFTFFIYLLSCFPFFFFSENVFFSCFSFFFFHIYFIASISIRVLL